METGETRPRVVAGHLPRVLAVEPGAQLGKICTFPEETQLGAHLEQVGVGDGGQVRVAAGQHQAPVSPPQRRPCTCFGISEGDQGGDVLFEQVEVNQTRTARFDAEGAGVLAGEHEVVVQRHPMHQGEVDQVAAGVEGVGAAVGSQRSTGEAQPGQQRSGEPPIELRPSLHEPPVGAHPLEPRRRMRDVLIDPRLVLRFTRMGPRCRD